MVNGAAASNGSVQAAPSQHPAAAYTLQEAAAVLGVSLNTLRRKIRSGEVRAERVRRPQGYVWRVELPDEQPASQHAAGTLPQDAPSTLQQPAADLLRAEAMASYSRSLLEPLVARLADQEAIIRGQAEELGHLRAELEYTRETPRPSQTHTDANLTAEVPPPPSEPSEPPSAPSPAPTPIPPQPNGGSSWWRRWWRALGTGLHGV